MRSASSGQSHVYAGGTLDRAAHRRTDADWLRQAWRLPEARVLPVWRGQVPLRLRQNVATVALAPAAWAKPLLDAQPALAWAFLGLQAEAPIFALGLEAEAAPETFETFVDVRVAAGMLARGDAALVAYGRALMHWRSRHRFCGVCGHACLAEKAGHQLVCPHCSAEHFPRTDAAVIMLVSDGERALLGRSAKFPKWTMYSTLAGFVEPGESLEEAVAREVLEEAGIIVGAVRYHSSQPWPFPANIMLGFEAEALSTAIVVDQTELLDARWFTRAELRAPDGFVLPPPESIARTLIHDWLNGSQERHLLPT